MLHTEAVNSLIKGEGEEVIWSNQQGISFQFLIFFFFGWASVFERLES